MLKTDLSQTLQFLSTLFSDSDNIATRPIESWTVPDPKTGRKSKTHYDRQYCTSLREMRGGSLESHLDYCDENGVNAYFGVCPRFEAGLGYEKAWQIRKVNFLWMDIDHCDPDDALELTRESGLPAPTVCVSTGNGVHLYWLLDEPYVIEAPDPPPLQWEQRDEDGAWCEYWLDENEGKNYTKVGGQKIWNGAPELCEDAKLIQYYNDGIAELIHQQIPEGAKMKADRCGDLGHILRLPGTLNVKGVKNGVPPKPCMIHQIDNSLRYSLSDFQAARDVSPKRKRDEEIAMVRLKAADRTKLTTKQQEKMDELLDEADATPVGYRSDVDFRICCYGIEIGLEPDYLFDLVEHTSKFAERGRAYYDTTYANAAAKKKEERWEQIQAKVKQSIAEKQAAEEDGTDWTAKTTNINDVTDARLAEFVEEEHASDLIYCDDTEMWLAWDGTIWAEGKRNYLESPVGAAS